MKIILIMGLPGSGKTTLAGELAPLLNAKRLNADEVRKEAKDWDFSYEGRKRQAKRMADFALIIGANSLANVVLPDPGRPIIKIIFIFIINYLLPIYEIDELADP